MRVTKQGEYALRSLISLGVARELGRDVVPVSELAEKERLPLKFVERILATLRGAGWVSAVRGKSGGYRLAMEPGRIVMGAVVRRIDGRLAPIGCASEAEYEPCTCPDEAHCGLRMLMIDVRNAIAGILDRYTLADLVQVTLAKLKRAGLQSSLRAAPEAASSRKESNRPNRPNQSTRSTRSKRERHADPKDGFLALLDSVTSEVGKPSGAAREPRTRAKRKVDHDGTR